MYIAILPCCFEYLFCHSIVNNQGREIKISFSVKTKSFLNLEKPNSNKLWRVCLRDLMQVRDIPNFLS